MFHILHCCQRSPSPLLPFRSATGSGRFVSMSTQSLMIHPSTRSRHCSLLGGATRTRHDEAVGELVPAAFLDASTSCCISVSSMSRRLPVAFVTGVGVSFDPSSSLHSLAMCSTCLLFDCHSDPCRLHLIPLHELRFPVISPSNHIGLIRGMIFVSECAIRTHPVPFDSASLPLEGKLIPRCTGTYTWFS